ncbi:MAG: hypothetical protein M3437_00670 [Chloroflexota bacterium]|nr:hypothetical protein [Chloroflexota bacterium]
MTEHIVEGVVSAEVEAESRRIVYKGTLGAETAAVPSEPANLHWKKRGQVHFIGPHAKTLAERLEDAYRDDVLTPEEKSLLDDAANQFGRRLSNEE